VRPQPRVTTKGGASPFKGITFNRGVLLAVAESKLLAHKDPTDPYRLPIYRDPQARKRARQARRAA
jgi:hypothetical protein